MSASLNAVVAHSGGPTPVLNASLLGVVEEAHRQNRITRLFGARFGIAGLATGNFIDLLHQPLELLTEVGRAPASALGTSREEITADHLDRALAVCRSRQIQLLFYTGGNGSMGTALQLQQAADQAQYSLQVIGIPKTIDNDLLVTDHSPGYGSAARFFACALRDIGADNRALPGQIEVVEVLGRNAGWIAAATALARADPDDAPHLIYLPELPLPLDALCRDAEQVFREHNRCVISVCEGQLDEQGQPFGADVRTGSRGSLAMNLGHRLAVLLHQRTGLRARSEKPGLLGRSSALTVSRSDWLASHLCGCAAVKAGLAGERGKMVTLLREAAGSYRVSTGLVELETVAFHERLMPSEWLGDPRRGPARPFLDYVRPLAGDIEPHAQLLRLELADL